MKQVYLTLGAVVRNVEHYVKEWLIFNHLVGVERFVIILHDCQDNTERKIRELPFNKDIHVHYYEDFGKNCVSIPIESHKFIHKEYGRFTKWMLHIDSDEFFFGTKEDFLPNILDRYEDFGGLAAHWLMFGSNDHVLCPSGLSIEAFTHRKEDRHPSHRGVKSAYQPAKIVNICSSHLQVTDPSTVREHFDPVDMKIWHAPEPWSYDIVRCNHYYTRSMEDWVQRSKNRLSTKMYSMRKEFTASEFAGHLGGVEDTTILRFADQIREII